jgi:hypothetical protein
VEANFASTFWSCFHSGVNADGQGDAGGGRKCGSKVRRKKVSGEKRRNLRWIFK